MNGTQCGYEQAAARAAASGPWPEHLAAHVSACPTCSDAVLVAATLNAAAAATGVEPLPDPGTLWRAARRGERARAIERATLPITVMTRAALGAGTVAAGAGLVWLWPTVAGQFEAVARSLTAPAATSAGGTTIAFFSLAIVATCSAALALFETWAGE